MRSILLQTTLVLGLPAAVGAQATSSVPTPAPAPIARAAAAPAVAVVAPVTTIAFAAAVPAAAVRAPADPQRRVPSAPQPLLFQLWYPQDPADGMYRDGREALMRGDYRTAVRLFDEIQRRWPRSRYAPQSYYWEAFALSRGHAGTEDLRRARESLATLRSRYPDAEGVRDADALMQTINAQLAERGDMQGSAAVRRAATVVAQQQGCAGVDDENDTRVVALNALLQMDAQSALPVLRQVLARRDACSAPLRRKAVFLVSQKHSPETADILVDLVRNDPDREVREQAIFWLSQVDGSRAVEALEGILRSSRDPALQEKAIFALSQHRSPRSAELLRTYAMRSDVNDELRGQAIFWLGQMDGAAQAGFLRDIYGRIESDELKEKVLFSLSQQRSAQNSQFLMDIALNGRESLEMRKQALFWAGQSGSVPMSRMAELYDRVNDREVRDQLIFVFSQSREPAAVEKLMAIARTERDPELRKQAIFWLGQSKDPRAQQLLLELINN